jgi:acid phosphatase family membrane protein YuiD
MSKLEPKLVRRPFVAAFIAFAIAQITKLFTFYYTENRWDYTRIVGSGGMPSSHTAMVRQPPISITVTSSPPPPDVTASSA